MRVIKRDVEEFAIGDDLALTRPEAIELYEELAKALGMPSLGNEPCGNRYAHRPHIHGNSAHLYCGGHAYDQT